MQTKTALSESDVVRELFKVRKGVVEFVDVPDLGFVMIDGSGVPGDATFTNALQALYSVSYGAHFALKKAMGDAPSVMPLEALWWIDGAGAQATMERLAAGDTTLGPPNRRWQWRMMILQPSPVDAEVVAAAITDARAKKDLAALDSVRYERWAEGACAQILHVGPYATEGPTIVALHKAIADHGVHPRGQHHEIYLGDPRRAAPEKLRTILRQPIEA